MYLCICHAVTVSAVREVVEAGVRDVDELVERFSLAGADDCGSCLKALDELLRQTAPTAPNAAPRGDANAPDTR